MNITLTIDPNDPADLDDASATIDAFRDRLSPPDPQDLVAIVRQLMAGYGEGRTGYIRLVADAGDAGASQSAVAAHFGGDGHAIGGTHSSVERSWKALGGLNFGDQLIETAADGSHKMPKVFRLAVNQVVQELSL